MFQFFLDLKVIKSIYFPKSTKSIRSLHVNIPSKRFTICLSYILNIMLLNDLYPLYFFI